MNNPLASSFGDFKIKSQKNRDNDEKSLVDRRDEGLIKSGNQCQFPKNLFVINLASRPDRWEEFQTRNLNLFQNFNVQRWEATSISLSIPNVVDAIYFSFLNCLEDSLLKNESIVIMEDDAYLADGAMEKLKLAWMDLPEDWDVLIGNHYFFGELEILTDNLAKPRGRASTANFCIFKNTSLSKIKDYALLRDSYPSIRDFDHYITSEMVPINNFSVWPMVSREISSFSDHKQKKLDSSIKIRENAFKYKFIDQDPYYSSIEGW